MLRPSPLFASLAGLLIVGSLQAQVSFGGQPYGPKAAKLGLPDAPLVEMPAVDVDAFMAEDAARGSQHIPGPFRFGCTPAHGRPFPWTTAACGTNWPTATVCGVWRVACPGALNVTLIFSEYVIPNGGRVHLYNRMGDAGRRVHGGKQSRPH